MFSYPSELEAHVAGHRGKRKFPCIYPGCGKSYQTPYHLRLHQCRHTGEKRPHPCTHTGCDRSFNTQSALRKHEGTHEAKEVKKEKGQEQWKCEVDDCERHYASAAALRAHTKKQHSGEEERFKCPVDGCSKGYYFKCHLERHIKKQHPPQP